jgi:hypothetical protein
VDHARRKVPLRVLEVVHREYELSDVALATGSPRRLAGSLHRRQKQPDERADDRDHDQQLHEGESAGWGRRDVVGVHVFTGNGGHDCLVGWASMVHDRYGRAKGIPAGGKQPVVATLHDPSGFRVGCVGPEPAASDPVGDPFTARGGSFAG